METTAELADAWTRRTWLSAAGTALGTVSTQARASDPAPAEPFGYCFNTSTVMGQKLNFLEQIELAARAGYQGIEPWLRDVDQFTQSGGSLKDAAKLLRDRGLAVAGAIAFDEWIVDDPERRKKGLEGLKRSMDVVCQLGGSRIAAPPAGATKEANLNLHRAAERYRAILELGEQAGVVPMVELWGFSQVLSKLSEVLSVALETGHAQACLLLDIYHLYKGGSGYAGLRLLNGAALPVIHCNDYPAKERAAIADADRVYPGDGVAPLKSIFRDLRANGFRGMLSLELFNRLYWQQDALTVAKTGLAKMKVAVRASLES